MHFPGSQTSISNRRSCKKPSIRVKISLLLFSHQINLHYDFLHQTSFRLHAARAYFILGPSYYLVNKRVGPSIKYVTLFLANVDPLPLSHFVSHPGAPPSTSHISDPSPILEDSTKIPDKSPLYKFSLNCSRGFCSEGFCQRVFCLEGFVRGGFYPLPLLSEYICYNRKLNITLNFMFHMHDIFFTSVTSHALDPLPLSQAITPSRTPSNPLERDVLYGRPLY